jgi:hypothetical protein
MFRNQRDDLNGFVNEGLDVGEGNECPTMVQSGQSSSSSNLTKIQVIRTKYNQESLFREMNYRKSTPKSCELSNYFFFAINSG